MQKNNLKHWLKKIGIALLLVITISFATSYVQNIVPDAMAQLSGGGSGLVIPEDGATISQDISRKPFGELIIDIVNYFVGFLGTIAVIMFIYAGVLWVVGGGNEEMITKAKKIMIYAGIGLIVVIMSYSAVRFITSSAGDSPCNDGEGCDPENTNTVCQDIAPADAEGPDWQCVAFGSASQLCSPPCITGEWCVWDTSAKEYMCKTYTGPGQAEGDCYDTNECPLGEWCSAELECVPGADMSCVTNEECEPPKTCDIYGFCRNPNANAGSHCEDSTDCPSRFVCNLDTNTCEAGGTGTGGIEGGASQGSAEDTLNDMDALVDDLADLLDGIGDDINGLPDDMKSDVLDALGAGLLSDKMASIEALMDETDDPAVLAVLERILNALEKLNDLREEMDDLREVMPESIDTIEAWDETSEILDELIDDPISNIKFRRFENRYRELRELIHRFPIVNSSIHAAPGSGNVPFTVTLDGLDSLDPTGGTISDYKWSFLDSFGNLVSLGNDPVIIHEFTEPNTYSVRLQVSTSKTDSDGYKTAMDGVSYVRIRANPPASQVAFNINGNKAMDVFHVTLEEAKAGVAFDPAPTVPALGRIIQKYEWLYGDTISEERTGPTTVIHAYNKADEYFVTLKVTDNHGITDKRIVKLFVKSLAADISIKPSSGNVNTEFQFRGINSRSDDGAIKSYEWKIEDNEGKTVVENDEESFSHRFNRPGEYKIILTVTDITGAKDKSLEVLDITSRPPVASFTYATPEANHPNRVEFSALNSYDPDKGDSITYSWDFDGDGDFEIIDTDEIRVTHEYSRVGQYRAVLQVEDQFEKRSQSQKGISIDSVLSGDIILPKRAAQVGEEVIFKSVSPNGVAYLWEFGDSETTSTEEKEVTYTYSKKGKYRVKFNFFDNEDNDNSDIAYMLIGDQDTPIAVANTAVNGRDQGFMDNLCGEGKHGFVVTRADNLLMSGRDSINTDGSGRLLTYDWKLADGTRSSRKEFNHKFDEINREGECFSSSLVVRDQVSGKVSEEDTIYFKVINELPTIVDFVIHGEEEKELMTPTKIQLKAVNPKDADGQVKKYRWWYYREGFDQEKLGIHSTTAPDTEMVITAEGQPDVLNRYLFVLEMTDNDGGVYSTVERFGELSYMDIKNGPNLSPVAEFTMDKTTISVGDSITFISQSYDPQGDSLPNDSFRWDFDGDGEFDDTSSGPQVNRQFNTPGEYKVRLKVVHRGLSSSATKTVFVEQVDTLPQAAFTYTVDGTTVTFDGGNSRYDPNLPDITLRYEWDFNIQDDANGNGINDDDVESTEITPSYIYPTLGIYKVRLKVKDALGMEGIVVRDIDLGVSAEDRERNTYRSAEVNSPNQPITTLDVSISPVEIVKGGTADIGVHVLNADGSPYYGDVFFEIVEGSGEFTPNPVNAKDSKANAIFSAIDSGTVRIKIRATGTYYGEVTEEAILNVK